MKKINITAARKLFNKGEKIYVLSNKVMLGNPWVSPSSIEKINDETFDYIINAYCAYMPHELGTRCAFYVND